jgi:DNA-binding CsgD family transcriptional regulator
MDRVARLQAGVAEIARTVPCRRRFRLEVMEILDREIGFVDGMLHFMHPDEPEERGVIITAAPGEIIHEGLSNWGSRYSIELNPLWRAAVSTGGVVIDTRILGPDSRSRLTFYTHIMSEIKAHHTMWSHLDVRGETVATLALTRRGGGFHDDDVRLVRELRAVLAIAEGCYRSAHPAPGGELESRLTARELEIVRLVVRGLTNPEIAVVLSLSFHTVRNHLNSIFRKLGVTTRAELAGLAASHLS